MKTGTFGRTYLFITIILIVAAAMRLVFLDRLPSAITGDELVYITTARSVLLTGADLSGTWKPADGVLFRHPPNQNQAELPYYIQLLNLAFFGNSLPAVKMLSVFSSICIVLLIYAITVRLAGQAAGIAAALAASVNPWLVVSGRTAYETTMAVCLYLAGLYAFISPRKFHIYTAPLFLILAFYAYIGTKLIFIPFVILAYLLMKHVSGKKIPSTVGVQLSILMLFFIISSVLILKGSTGARMSELFLPTNPSIAETVDSLRKATINTPITHLFINKATVYLTELASKTLRIMSPSYLFLDGDQFFLTVRHGFFYLIDFPLIFLGILYLYSKNKAILFTLVGFILLGAVPHVFNTTEGDFSSHLALMFPFIIILIGSGAAYFVSMLKNRVLKITAGIIASALYAVSIGSFIVTYALQYPITGASDFPIRQISKYIKLSEPTAQSILILSNRPKDILYKYVYYANAMDAQSIAHLKNTFSGPLPVTIGSITFDSCMTPSQASESAQIVLFDTLCPIQPSGENIRSIRRISDAGTVWNIQGDTICAAFQLHSYPEHISLSDFSLEKMDTKTFCETFISN